MDLQFVRKVACRLCRAAILPILQIAHPLPAIGLALPFPIVSEAAHSSLVTRHSSLLWPLAIALLALWLPVFYRLSFFWETDEQYSHGWFVPLLAAWIFYTRWQTLPPSASHAGLPRRSRAEAGAVLRGEREGGSPVTPALLYALLATSLLPLSFAYWVSEANPDWRMMMWIMAGSAFLGSLVLTQIFGRTAWTKHLWFAFFFALVSVPWPFGPEKWLTLELSMLAARLSTAILSLGGIPAVCVGNTIEVSSGVLGVDEACSGIRSFQSSIMAGLFLGELYMLRLGPRIFLCLVGLVVAYALNVVRMLILSVAVETTGSVHAINQWHDPAGFVILIVTMAILWSLCALAAKFPGLVSPSLQFSGSSRSPSLSPDLQPQVSHSGLSPSSSSDLRPPNSTPLVTRHSPLVTIAVIAAMLLTAIGTEAWFRYKESQNLVKLPDWGITPPPSGGAVEDKPLDPFVEKLLGQDIGFERSWADGKGRQWNLIFLRWLPGNLKGEGAPHAPDLCQTGAGHTITAKSGERKTQVHGIPFPYYLYSISGGGQPFYLMYVINDERFAGERVKASAINPDAQRSSRLQAALDGRRRTGNRSLQLALVGVGDAQEAEQAMLEILPTLIQRND